MDDISIFINGCWGSRNRSGKDIDITEANSVWVATANSLALFEDEISICVEKPYTYETFPCENQPFTSETVTDQNGNFMSAELPVGLYIITLEINGVWVELSTDYGTIDRIPVSEGQVTELPDLYLSS